VSGSGAQYTRTTAGAVTPGRIFRMIKRASAAIGGARTDWPVSAMSGNCSASALALWNGRDPILKERLFGLTNSEANHGEDVKEYYFYLDATPTSSYLKMLYKYPQAEYPYNDLVATSRSRGNQEPTE
jgi:hypothetical protein